MKRTLNGAIAAVAALALTGGIFAATALPAAAATPANVAYATGASGLLGGIQPLGEASYPGTSPVTLAQVNGLVVSSSCASDASTNTVTGTASIVGGQVLAGLTPTPLPTSPQPNTTVSVPGLATITLNKQVSSGGTLEVDALSISLLGGAQTITIGTSVCNAADLSAG